MGCEFGQAGEWRQSGELAWDEGPHALRNAGLRRLVQRPDNRSYRAQPALHRRDCEHSGIPVARPARGSIRRYSPGCAWVTRMATHRSSLSATSLPVERRDWQLRSCPLRRALAGACEQRCGQIYGGSGRRQPGRRAQARSDARITTSRRAHAMTLPPLSTLDVRL